MGFTTAAALVHELMEARNLAGNPDSPRTTVFLTSIIDELAGL